MILSKQLLCSFFSNFFHLILKRTHRRPNYISLIINGEHYLEVAQHLNLFSVLLLSTGAPPPPPLPPSTSWLSWCYDFWPRWLSHRPNKFQLGLCVCIKSSSGKVAVKSNHLAGLCCQGGVRWWWMRRILEKLGRGYGVSAKHNFNRLRCFHLKPLPLLPPGQDGKKIGQRDPLGPLNLHVCDHCSQWQLWFQRPDTAALSQV